MSGGAWEGPYAQRRIQKMLEMAVKILARHGLEYSQCERSIMEDEDGEFLVFELHVPVNVKNIVELNFELAAAEAEAQWEPVDQEITVLFTCSEAQ